MSRRKFLSLVTNVVAAESFARSGWGATPPSPAKAPKPAKAPRIRGICFDLFTIFDPRSVARAADKFAPGRGRELWNVWKVRQFEYSWLRASARRYVDFEVVTEQALVYAANELKISLSSEARRELVAAYSELEPWPDTRAALSAWKNAGMKLAPLANYSPKMIRRLIARNALEGVFDTLISTDAAQSYKPDPRAYALGPACLGLAREQIAFSAFGGWDAAGATWFGFPTFWLNRLGDNGRGARCTGSDWLGFGGPRPLDFDSLKARGPEHPSVVPTFRASVNLIENAEACSTACNPGA